MSTRSNIAIELPDGKVKAIYVHSDGYPNGVGHCLLNYYNAYKKALDLFAFGNCSSLGSTLKECSFYARDWGRDQEEGRDYNNEWCYLRDLSGDVFIEYVYLFKKGHWYVSHQKWIKAPKDHYDSNEKGGLSYLTKMVRIEKHSEYRPDKIDPKQPTEKDMVAQLGKLLSKHFKSEDMLVQGGKANKKKMN